MRKLLLLTLLLTLVPAPARALTGPLYGLGAAGELYALEPSDASTTLLGTVAGVTASSALVWDPVSASLWFADHVAGDVLIKSIDLGSFTATTVVTLDAGFVDSDLRDLAILSTGQVFGFGWTPSSGTRHELFEIDRATGVSVSRLTNLPGGLAALDPNTLLFQGGDGLISVPSFVGGVVPGYTGDFTNRGTQMTHAADEDATYFLENCVLDVFCPGQPLYRVDRAAKIYARIGPPDAVLRGIAIGVPEPSAAPLALVALGALGRSAHRRR